MLIQNITTDRIHRWRQSNNTYLVWAPGQVRDIDETVARHIAQGHPDKMDIVTYFPADDEYRHVDPGEEPATTDDTTETDEGETSGDTGDLLASANLEDAAEKATPTKKPSRRQRRTQNAEVSGNG